MYIGCDRDGYFGLGEDGPHEVSHPELPVRGLEVVLACHSCRNAHRARGVADQELDRFCDVLLRAQGFDRLGGHGLNSAGSVFCRWIAWWGGGLREGGAWSPGICWGAVREEVVDLREIPGRCRNPVGMNILAGEVLQHRWMHHPVPDLHQSEEGFRGLGPEVNLVLDPEKGGKSANTN